MRIMSKRSFSFQWLAGGFGDDLLGEDVERRGGRVDAVEAAGVDGADEGGALDELVAGRREEASLGGEAERVAGAADALEEGGDAAGRFELADEIDRADIDPELKGSGGDECLHFAGLEAAFETETAVFGEAAVMGADLLFAETLGEVEGGAFGEAACVDEDQGGPVLRHKLGEAVVHVAPLLAGGDGLKIGRRDIDRKFEVALVAGVDDRAVGLAIDVDTVGADEEPGGVVERLDGGGEADARRALLADVVEPRKSEREMAAALVADESVDLVDDDGA